MRNLPRLGIESVSLALAGRFSSMVPTTKSHFFSPRVVSDSVNSLLFLHLCIKTEESLKSLWSEIGCVFEKSTDWVTHSLHKRGIWGRKSLLSLASYRRSASQDRVTGQLSNQGEPASAPFTDQPVLVSGASVLMGTVSTCIFSWWNFLELALTRKRYFIERYILSVNVTKYSKFCIVLHLKLSWNNRTDKKKKNRHHQEMEAILGSALFKLLSSVENSLPTLWLSPFLSFFLSLSFFFLQLSFLLKYVFS